MFDTYMWMRGYAWVEDERILLWQLWRWGNDVVVVVVMFKSRINILKLKGTT